MRQLRHLGLASDEAAVASGGVACIRRGRYRVDRVLEARRPRRRECSSKILVSDI
jgi:hypothetical protein